MKKVFQGQIFIMIRERENRVVAEEKVRNRWIFYFLKSIFIYILKNRQPKEHGEVERNGRDFFPFPTCTIIFLDFFGWSMCYGNF